VVLWVDNDSTVEHSVSLRMLYLGWPQRGQGTSQVRLVEVACKQYLYILHAHEADRERRFKRFPKERSLFFFPTARQPLGGLSLLVFRGFAITHFRHTTLSRTPLDEGQARRRDLYLTTHNTHNRQISMP
jgi:hypothetical protein